MSQDEAKRAAGVAAAAWVDDGMRVGLGTGSTTAFALIELGRRVREEGLEIVGVPTSFAAERLARKHRIPLITLDNVPSLDIALDGADEIDPHLNLIKGRGAAHTREKVVAALATRFVVLADHSKRVDQLGTRMPIPVEVLPMAIGPVIRRIEILGGTPEIRMGRRKDGPVVTDQGFWIVDAQFKDLSDPYALDEALLRTPGVLDHGLFLNMATEAVIGNLDGEVQVLAFDA